MRPQDPKCIKGLPCFYGQMWLENPNFAVSSTPRIFRVCTRAIPFRGGGNIPIVPRGRVKIISLDLLELSLRLQGRKGKILQDPGEIRNRWKEYVEELYQSENKPKDLDEGPYMGLEDDKGPDVLREEVLVVINDMKNNKAEGVDNIPVEMVKNLGGKATAELVRLCQDIYNTEMCPEAFLQTIMT